MLKAKLQIRKKIKLCMAVCAAAVLMCSVIPVSAAERGYDVTFRAGSKGYFGADQDNKSVKVEDVAYGTTIGAVGIPSVNISEPGYYQTGWSPELTADTPVTKRQAYVAQYARITDAVDYRVSYVDAAGMPVATQKVTTTQKGAEVTETAPAVDGYTVDAAEKTATINENGTEIRFVYTAGQNVVTETQTQTETTVVPGTTTTTTTGGTAAGTTTGGTAGTTTPAAGGAGTTTAGDAGTEDAGTTTITDENVPLADNPAGDAEDTENLEDEEVPKANKNLSETSPWAYAGIAAGVIALAGIVILIIRRKKMS